MRQRQEGVRARVFAGVEENPGQGERELGVPGHDLGRDLIHDLQQRRALSPARSASQ